MKKIIGLLLLFYLLSPSVKSQSLDEDTLSQLRWLVGKWERVSTNPNQTAFEEWDIKENMLIGKGVTIQESDTVFIENLSIVSKEGDLFYVAEVVSNPQPTWFKIKSYSEKGFVSENSDHDFPKKIEYWLENNGELTATISGDGKYIPFIFRKKEN